MTKALSTRRNRRTVARPRRWRKWTSPRGPRQKRLKKPSRYADSEDEEPEVSEACEEEQESSDEGAEAEWEDEERRRVIGRDAFARAGGAGYRPHPGTNPLACPWVSRGDRAEGWFARGGVDARGRHALSHDPRVDRQAESVQGRSGAIPPAGALEGTGPALHSGGSDRELPGRAARRPQGQDRQQRRDRLVWRRKRDRQRRRASAGLRSRAVCEGQDDVSSTRSA